MIFFRYSPLLFCLFFVSVTTTIGQTNTFQVSGKVTDQNNQPLYGTNVIVKGSTNGTVTDKNGNYIIKGNLNKTITIDFSFLGYTAQSRDVDFSASKSQILNIVLTESLALLDDVSIVAKSKIRKAREQAYAINVIKAAELYNTGADLNQVLNRTSGVRVREDGGLGSSFTFSLNGFSGKQVKFFLDGIPIDNFGSSLTLNNFPVNLASNIEIYKGVLPITLGSDALGGAVNIVTRTEANYLDISYGYGSFNTHKANINFAYTAPKSGFTVRAITFYNYSDNNYKVDVRPIDLETNQRLPEQEVERFHDGYKSATAQVEIGVVNKAYADKLLVGFIASGNDKEIQTGVIMDQVFGARTTNSSAFIPTLKYYKTDLFTEGLDFRFYGAYNSSKNQFIDTTRVRYNWLQETVPTTSAEFFRTQLENKDDEALVTSNLMYALNNIHSLSLNYQYTDFNRESDDVENPQNVTFQFPQRLKKQTLGLAYQAKYERFNSTLFSKYYTLKAESFMTAFGSNITTAQNSELDNLGYGIATTYFILPKLQAKASFERAFRMPESVELLGDGLFTRRNANLNPESSYNLNLGGAYEFDFSSKSIFSIEANYLFRKSEDFIRLDQSQSQPVDRQFVNIGKVQTNGIEASLQYDWDNRFRVSANLTYQEIIDKEEFVRTTNLGGTVETPNLNFDFRVPNIPYLYGNFNMDYAFTKAETSKNRFNIGYSLNYVQEYFFTPNQLGENNQDNIPTQLSHNALISYEIANGKFNISLEARNITDENLFDNYLLQKPGRSFFINLRYFLNKRLF